MRNRLITCCLIVSLSWSSYAQTKDSKPVFLHPSGKNFTYVLRQNIDIKNYRNRCMYRFGFVRFNIDSLGRMDSIYYSKSLPDSIVQCIAAGLKAVDGHWAPRIKNGRAAYSKPFLLPVEVILEGGCTYKSDESDKIAVRRILDFGNPMIGHNVDCIILGPSLIIHKQTDYRIKEQK